MPYCHSGAWEAQMPKNTALDDDRNDAYFKGTRVRCALSKFCQPVYTAGRLCSSHGGREIPRALKAGHTWDSESLARKDRLKTKPAKMMSSAPEE